MCTYNGAKYVAEQLESILNQTYSNLEVIIADDASTDDTYAVLQPYAERDKRIVLYRHEKNTGYNVNFSQACARTTAPFIAIADQDDIWELNKVERLYEAITQSPQISLVHGLSARFEEKGKPHLRSLKLVNHFRGNDMRLFFLSNFISGHNMLLRRSVLDAALPFPAHVYYDWWLAAQACTVGVIESVEEILTWHRMHGQNATGAAKPKVAFYKQVQSILPTILSIKKMKKEEREMGEKLLEHYQAFPAKKTSWPLYFFLLKWSPVIFSYKKRTFPWISYMKHSLRYAKRSTLA